MAEPKGAMWGIVGGDRNLHTTASPSRQTLSTRNQGIDGYRLFGRWYLERV